MVKQLINSPPALHNMTITLVFLIMNISDVYMSTVWSYNVYTVSACLLSALRAPEPSQNAFKHALKTRRSCMPGTNEMLPAISAPNVNTLTYLLTYFTIRLLKLSKMPFREEAAKYL